ncbi:hypothetical protein FTUN_6622 [Frigoriglobus tundricola]|uniref:Uncharacterized protein n=1 Tax=Frigoriglobus tundricola TaxID=2774151 RepID=A0A6M5YYH0_9BACT|nr:hypothetical protein FTUN_6622 [Frigoriglobus tundricola]
MSSYARRSRPAEHVLFGPPDLPANLGAVESVLDKATPSAKQTDR